MLNQVQHDIFVIWNSLSNIIGKYIPKLRKAAFFEAAFLKNSVKTEINNYLTTVIFLTTLLLLTIKV
jgi:hypothetical protein